MVIQTHRFKQNVLLNNYINQNMIVPKFYHNKENKSALPKPTRIQRPTFQEVFKVKDKVIPKRFLEYHHKKVIEFQKPKQLERWAQVHKISETKERPRPKTTINFYKTEITRSELLLRQYSHRKELKAQSQNAESIRDSRLQTPVRQARIKTVSTLKRKLRSQRMHSTAISFEEEKSENSTPKVAQEKIFSELCFQEPRVQAVEIAQFQGEQQPAQFKKSKRFRRYSQQVDPRERLLENFDSFEENV